MSNIDCNRLLVFQMYSESGAVSENVFPLLQQLSEVVTRIIVVCNNILNHKDTKYIRKYTNEIIIRENLGLDYGAYRDVIVNYLGRNAISKYDELVLCNDTFYGFFSPIEEIFDYMMEKHADVWGLNVTRRGLLDNIQGFFLVFGHNALKSGLIYEYFYHHTLDDNDYGHAVSLMETKMWRFFNENALKVSSYIDTCRENIYFSPYNCIIKYGLPILKKKCLTTTACDNEILYKILNYLKKNELYPYIINIPDKKKEVKNKRGSKSPYSLLDENKLLKWAKLGPFYIFGAGFIGRVLYFTYFENDRNFKGFVASYGFENDDVNRVEEIPENSRIIVGVIPESQEEVSRLIPETMSKLLIWDTSEE